MSQWITVCELDDLIPGTGVCALVNNKQIAIFRPDHSEQLFALNNMDPFAQSNVLSRGIICQHDNQLWIASPLKKQRFSLKDGHCFENPEIKLECYSVQVKDSQVLVSL
ncbi:nitrite reductase small subunit NirD [Shewanella violacea]|uniref:Nitrite reductase (NADH) small subunit n=1 Tax=Shewanella violacea (strain JCM 10179 / CIP 106290 / LMG 19151 / DSS12) TaxID=637905 RepID=D4ZBU6_SHEVD|nr:nitrite reductase small subunit NirD [Shewanella violacea]BAJ03491.1 nitrite reductase [NAD(P)H], small subunit [Shewanella violacea DSS12]